MKTDIVLLEAETDMNVDEVAAFVKDKLAAFDGKTEQGRFILRQVHVQEVQPLSEK